jgi:transcriptional regulator with XRE-family HTH domain
MDSIMPKSIVRAKFVKKEREKRAWTQSKLAENARVTLRTIQRLERNGAVSFDTLTSVAKALQIDISDLSLSSGGKRILNNGKEVHSLPRIYSGKQLIDLFDGADQYQFEHDEIKDEQTLRLALSDLDFLKKCLLRWHDANEIDDYAEKLEIEWELSTEIDALEHCGAYLFGIKRRVPVSGSASGSTVMMATVYMSFASSPRIVKDKNSNMSIPAFLPETIYNRD